MPYNRFRRALGFRNKTNISGRFELGAKLGVKVANRLHS